MALLSGLFSILFFLILIFRQEITEFFVENDQTVVRIGKRKFQVEKYEHIITASFNLGCYFFVDKNGSAKRFEKESFKSDENITQGMLLKTWIMLLCSILVIQMKTPHFINVNQSFFNQAIRTILMSDSPSTVFEFKYKTFKVNSIPENYNERFYCCLDPAKILINSSVANHKEEGCIGDQLVVYMSVKTTPLIWKMLDDEAVYYQEFNHVMNIFENIHNFNIERQDYDVYPENCPNSFLLCDTKFMNSLFARSDDLVFLEF
ncbi:unnamed protein product [Oikopleura dioica]|uniref:Uncharacterized protein n=2 Tax=Oikopleura dioica TaxID=34765 RepID=E4XJJ4_OIKDI|nr:unnamed protein product [Oikopleura dioica]